MCFQCYEEVPADLSDFPIISMIDESFLFQFLPNKLLVFLEVLHNEGVFVEISLNLILSTKGHGRDYLSIIFSSKFNQLGNAFPRAFSYQESAICSCYLKVILF